MGDIYSQYRIIDMAFTQIDNQMTGRLAGDRDRWVIYSHHHIIYETYTYTCQVILPTIKQVQSKFIGEW